ncbi:hypothetical protein BGZ70_001339 [Mortierella alpina]|uniref:Uncharacterized protein n=1 Tax=Mortierella alpina TaxID=64518 RepID=A0A9P6LY65_MORAP|nr:hypothetical protein BGZ70_001339 [Mortierella alpina]
MVDDDLSNILPLRIEPYPGEVLSLVVDDALPQRVSEPTGSSSAFGGIAPLTGSRPASASSSGLSSTVSGPSQNETSLNSREGSGGGYESASRAEFSTISNITLSVPNPSPVSNISISTAGGSNPTQTLYLSATATGTDPIGDTLDVSRQSTTGEDDTTIAHEADQASMDIDARVKRYTKYLRESEWHEAPSPRLFIVLPVSTASKGYIFYWLCEDFSCGELIPHLTHEPGIELNSPDQFFSTYGEILQFGLHLFKSTKGIIIDGDERWYNQGIRFLGRELSWTCEQVELSIDSMIKLLQVRLFSRGGPPQTRSEALPQFKDDLYGIQSFLSKRQFSSGMSKEEHHGLFRLVGKEGNIQWVCSTHFYTQRSCNFDPPFIQRVLRDYGSYDVQRGLIAARVHSKAAANAMSSIYDAVIRGLNCVSEFSLHLAWEATDPDLDELCCAVAGFNLVSVVVTSTDLRKRQSAIAKPIKHIFERNRIQSFGLGSFCESQRVFDSLLLAKRSSKLRSLRLALNTKGWDSRAIKEHVDRVIGKLPLLDDLEVMWDELEQVPHLESSLRSFAAGVQRPLSVTMKGQTQEVTLYANVFVPLRTPSSLRWSPVY